MSSSGTSRVSSAMAGLSSSTDVESVVSPYDTLHRLYAPPGVILTILSAVSLVSVSGYLLTEIAYIAPGNKRRIMCTACPRERLGTFWVQHIVLFLDCLVHILLQRLECILSP